MTIETIVELPVDRLVGATKNPRIGVGDVAELAASIKTHGVLEPLIVTANGHDTHVVVMGHRRLAGAKLAGLKTVPCIVRTYAERELLTVMLIENLQRADLAPLEEARGYKQLADMKLSTREIAKRVGRGQSHIVKRLALQKLTKAATEKLAAGAINLEDAVVLAAAAPAVQDLVLAEKRQWGSMAQRVSEATRKAANEKLRSDAIAKLPESLKVIPVDEWGNPQGEHRLAYLHAGKGPNNQLQVHLGRDEHRKLACAAVYVDAGGMVVDVCTDPRTHMSAAEIKSSATGGRLISRYDKAAGARERAAQKARNEAKAARLKLLPRIISRGERELQWAVELIATVARSDESRIACELLKLQPGRRGSSFPAYAGALAAHARKSKKGAVDVAIALALGVGESHARSTYAGPGGVATIHVAELVKVAGYKPNAIDRKLLKGRRR